MAKETSRVAGWVSEKYQWHRKNVKITGTK